MKTSELQYFFDVSAGCRMRHNEKGVYMVSLSKMSLRSSALLAFCALSQSAQANDSSAEVAVGGLTLTKSDSISMDSEDPFISRGEVRVKYQFTNTSDAPIETLVAFPLPDAPPSDDNDYWPLDSGLQDALKFKTLVNGIPAALMIVEQAKFGGRDITAALKKLSIPLNHRAESFGASINRLAAKDRKKLIADGWIRTGRGQGQAGVAGQFLRARHEKDFSDAVRSAL
jgi:Domain of unknown function (DUF4424)